MTAPKQDFCFRNSNVYIYGLSTLVLHCYYQRNRLTLLIVFLECLRLDRIPKQYHLHMASQRWSHDPAKNLPLVSVASLEHTWHFTFCCLCCPEIGQSTITDIPNASNAGVACFETKDYHTVFFDPDRSMRFGAAHEGVKSVGI